MTAPGNAENVGAAFAEIHPPLSESQAAVEAARCLYCYDAPCTRACPTHIDIPRFIRQILHRDPIGAAGTILAANIFGGSCARACPVEVLCEGACVENTHLKLPIRIGALQRFACDTAHEISTGFFEAGPDTGRKIAITGAGPAGLTCAHELRKRGHAVTIFEARALPGGLNTVGIAAYKISTEFALAEVQRVQAIGGIDLRLASPIDGSKLAELLNQFDAVFLAVGLGRTAPLHIPGEQAAGVLESLDFIARTHAPSPGRLRIGRHVVVIGGGNTALDCANAAVRLGAERVTLAYRRSREAMPGFAHETALAEASGVRFEWNALPTEILSESGKAACVRFVRTRATSDRHAPPQTIPNSEFVIAADTVIKALGQETMDELLRAIPGLQLSGGGRVLADPRTGATSVPRLFAGGDCQQGAKEEVVNAVQAGKIAAAGIHEFLKQAY
ncbi:Glutamate synthase [NADPH] small chain [Phycisphaerae bacterium RAS1]|nr:Glutamate synthase [NADPH] small chain [Phycisphaerae bacterium RAS1]